MNSAPANVKPFRILWIAGALACGSLSASGVLGAQQTLIKKVSAISAIIGSNELDAIEFCRGIVDAQYEYAFQKRDGHDVNQYAQHIISTSDKHDGLAWKNADGSWAGPVGERAARAIGEGYTSSAAYHGYFFKVLKGQGPDAPLGEMDFVVKGVMIGGFALVAAPAQYGETGLKTFIVSHDGVVYQKDLGSTTLEAFKNMERFNPDSSWTPVPDED
jgi:Protein of unknown function (DUF2950)